MAKDDLIPFDQRSESEVKAIAARGGRNSGATRRKNKALRDCLKAILKSSVSGDDTEAVTALLASNGLPATYDNAMSLALISKALTGDPKAFEVVRDTIGEKPVDKLEHGGNVTVNTGLLADILGQLKDDGP